MQVTGGALLSCNLRGNTYFLSLSGKEERGSNTPAGGVRKSNKLVHASEQEKGTRDTTGVKFYYVPLPSLWNTA